MTITNEQSMVVGQGNGVNRNWNFGFLLPSASDVKVYVTNNAPILPIVTLIDAADYDITGLGDTNGGIVTYPKTDPVLAAGYAITIVRDAPYQQEFPFTDQSLFPPDIEDMGDQDVLEIQQVANNVTRALLVPFGSAYTPEEYVLAIVGDVVTPPENQGNQVQVFPEDDDIQDIFNNNQGREIHCCPSALSGEAFFDNLNKSILAGEPVELTIPPETTVVIEPGYRLNTSGPCLLGIRLSRDSKIICSKSSLRYVGPNYNRITDSAPWNDRPNYAWAPGDPDYLAWATGFCNALGLGSPVNTATLKVEIWLNDQFPTIAVKLNDTSIASRLSAIGTSASYTLIESPSASNYNNAWKIFPPNSGVNVGNIVTPGSSNNCDMGGQVSEQVSGKFAACQITNQTNVNTDAENHKLYHTGNDGLDEFSYAVDVELTGSYVPDGEQAFGHDYKLRSFNGTVTALDGHGGQGMLTVTEHTRVALPNGRASRRRIAYGTVLGVPHTELPNQGSKEIFAFGNDAIVTGGYHNVDIVPSGAGIELQGGLKYMGLEHGSQQIGGGAYISAALDAADTPEALIQCDGRGVDGPFALVRDHHISYVDSGGIPRKALLPKNGCCFSLLYVDKYETGWGPLLGVSGAGYDNIVKAISKKIVGFNLQTAVDQQVNVGHSRNEVIPTDVARPMLDVSTAAAANLNFFARASAYVPDAVTVAQLAASNYAVGGKTYTFQTAGTFNPAGTNNVLIEEKGGGDLHVVDTLINLEYCINDSTTHQDKYGTGTTANANLRAFAANNAIQPVALVAGYLGNAQPQASTIPTIELSGAFLTQGGTPDLSGAVGLNVDATAGSVPVVLPRYPDELWGIWLRKRDTSTNTVPIQDYTGAVLYTLRFSGDECYVLYINGAFKFISTNSLPSGESLPTVNGSFIANIFGIGPSLFANLTSSAVISGFDDAPVGTWRWVRLTGSPDFKHSNVAPGIVCPGGEYIQGEAGDTFLVESIGSSFSKIHFYTEYYRRPSKPNLLLNSAFQFWRRGTSIAVINAKTMIADGWMSYRGASNCTTSQVAGFNGAASAIKLQRTAANVSTNPIALIQQVSQDDVLEYAGNYLNVTEDVLVGANYSGGSLSLRIYTSATAGEMFDPNTLAFPSTTTATLWATVDVTVPPVQGGTYNYNHSANIVPADAKSMALRWFWTPSGTAGADDSLTFTHMQAVRARNKASYAPEPFAVALARCESRYFKTFLQATTPAQNAGVDTGEFTFAAGRAGALAEFATFFYPTQEVEAPTVTTYNPAAANAQVRDRDAAADCSAVAVSNVSRKSCVVGATGNAGTAVGNKLGVHITVDSLM